MLLTKVSNTILIRATAVMSVIVGILYMPSLIHFSLPIAGLGPELIEGREAAELWANYAVFGGMAILAGSFLTYLSRAVLFQRLLLSAFLIAAFLLTIAQLPPLFWWIYVGAFVFSWSSVIAFSLHCVLLALAVWGALVTIYSFERLHRN
ncbi:hypothetical protein [Paenibacillus sp. GCM10027626]|uniref:hypothetical protein n=1 Tax=Paenibacillus sp. GCM10027626 TaxID=3273411 RepID=UPI00363FAADC